MEILSFLENVGIVKTPRREAESVRLAKAVVRRERFNPIDKERFVELAKKNKVILRAAPLLGVPIQIVDEARNEFAEAMKLYDLMSGEFQQDGVSFVVIKSFDSLPDMGHDLDFLLPDPSEFSKAREILLDKFRVTPQPLTHCDKLVGKFSCYLPGFKHDFELYPTISQLGEEHMQPKQIIQYKKTEDISGRKVWVTSDLDRVMIRIIHAMFRHNFLKLSDVVDFETLARQCNPEDVLDAVERADIGDSFLFFIATIDRFLTACQSESPNIKKLRMMGETRFGKDRLGLFRRDRLVLPYRIPTAALVILFLLKGAREMARGKWRSSLKCLVSPPLLFLDFVNNIFGNKLFGRRIW